VLCAVIASATDSELLLLTNISTYVTHLHLCFETGYTVQAIQISKLRALSNARRKRQPNRNATN
jgi:hypothetical protein